MEVLVLNLLAGIPGECSIQINPNTSLNSNNITIVLNLSNDNVFNIYAPVNSTCTVVDISSMINIDNTNSTLTLTGNQATSSYIQKLYIYIYTYQSTEISLDFNITNNQNNIVNFYLSNQYNAPIETSRNSINSEISSDIKKNQTGNIKVSALSYIPDTNNANVIISDISSRSYTTPFILNPSTTSKFKISSTQIKVVIQS